MKIPGFLIQGWADLKRVAVWVAKFCFHPSVVYLLIVTALAIVAYHLMFWFGRWAAGGFEVPAWVSINYWQDGAPTSRSEVLRNLGLLAVGIFGLGFGVWRALTAHWQARTANRQADVAEQGQITARFSVAVEHLGSPQLPVRLGGIYALWRLAQDSPMRDMQAAVDIFCAFVRNPPFEVEEVSYENVGQGGVKPSRKLRSDSQAIMALLADVNLRFKQYLRQNYLMNFSGANLRGLRLLDAKFGPVNFSEADLRDASLRGCILDEAYFFRARLSSSMFINCGLRKCRFTGVDATESYFVDANLEEASLSGGNFANSSFSGANLSKAKLQSTDLSHCSLRNADLSSASFGTVKLEGASLIGADLSGARYLSQSKLATLGPSAPPKVLPENLVWPFEQNGKSWVLKK